MGVLTGILIARSTSIIYAQAFTAPAVQLPDRDCRAGLRRLHGAYESVWDARRSGSPDARLRPSLDAELHALRALCAREGPAAERSHESLVRWRYRAEGLTRLWTDTLTDDAARALGNHQDPPP